jgi:hypothetical protein
VDVVPLGDSVVWTCMNVPTFRRNVLPPLSVAVRSPERWFLPTSPHGVTTQKINTDKLTFL